MNRSITKLDKVIKQEIKTITGIEPHIRSFSQSQALYLLEYIKVLRTGGTELQQHTIKTLDKFRIDVEKERNRNVNLEDQIRTMHKHFQSIQNLMNEENIKGICNENL